MSIANFIYPALQVISLLQNKDEHKKTSSKYNELDNRINQLQDQLSSSKTIQSEMPVIPENKPSTTIHSLIPKFVDISKDLDEALRFARADGVEHPEALMRTNNAKKINEDLEDSILTIERINLSPANIANMNPDEKKVIDHVLPQIRKLRQSIVNDIDNVQGIEKSAAMANEISTQLKVANAVIAAKQPKNEKKSNEPYSKYAPNMTVDTGCIECGKAHIAMADITLTDAAQLAKIHGYASPEVQSKVVLAQQELKALRDYDWTDDKINNTSGKEKEVLIEYNPKITNIYNAVVNLENEKQLDKLAKQMSTTRNNFKEALNSI